MTFFGKYTIGHDARREAKAGVNSVNDQITRRLGGRPKNFDPVGNHEHGQVATALGRGPEIAEWTEDQHRAEAELIRHPSVTALNAGILFCCAVEVLGGILVMRGLGVGEGERLPLGLALGLALIGITAATSNHAAASSELNAERPRRRNATTIILSVYSLLVVALAVVRLRMSADDGGGLESFAEMVVMVATTTGPAWLTEYFLRKRRPAVVLERKVKGLRRRIRDAERERSAATTYVARLSRSQTAWDEEAERLRAAFQSEHRLASAEQGQRPISNNLNTNNVGGKP